MILCKFPFCVPISWLIVCPQCARTKLYTSQSVFMQLSHSCNSLGHFVCRGREFLPFLQAHIDQVIRVGTMSGRDPRAVENELFMRSQAHSASSYPRQPWEQPGLLCVFSPVQAAFPARLSIPYQGPAVIPTNVASATQSVPIALSSKSATPCEAWTRAVKAKRGVGSADKRQKLSIKFCPYSMHLHPSSI